jgi:hypothetical protein
MWGFFLGGVLVKGVDRLLNAVPYEVRARGRNDLHLQSCT